MVGALALAFRHGGGSWTGRSYLYVGLAGDVPENPSQDLGSFLALHSVASTDSANNVAMQVEGAEFLPVESKDCVVYAEGGRTVALFGVSDLLVVAVGDVTMVCPRSRAADLKTLVEAVAAAGRRDLL